jgi:hypothetical protein
MRFRRLFRRRRQPPPVLLPSLERLGEVVERVVGLLDEAAVAPPRQPKPKPTPTPGPTPDASFEPVPFVDGHLLFRPSPDGYRLLEREGAPPAPGDLVEIDGDGLSVLRLGPSPLPGDRRRCAYLERQEPSRADRTFDA